MAEIFALAAAAAASLEQAIKLFDRIRTAKNSFQDLPPLIERHREFVKSTKSILELVQKEESLKTEHVGAILVDIKETARTLATRLTDMSAQVEKGAIVGFAHHLFSGSDDQKRLDTIMTELTREKTALGLSLSLVNIGLTKSVDQAIGVNTAAVEELNTRLKALLGEQGGLKIAELIKGKRPNGDGTVMLNYNDIAKMAGLRDNPPQAIEIEVPGDAQGKRKIRQIQNNVALKDALQVNTPVGEDIWAHMDVIIVQNNIADVEAAQFNYPLQSQDFLESLRIKYGARTG